MIESPSNFKLGSIVKRIQKNQETFQAKFKRKMKAESDFYKEQKLFTTAMLSTTSGLGYTTMCQLSAFTRSFGWLWFIQCCQRTLV
jgi:predicted sugar kinase